MDECNLILEKAKCKLRKIVLPESGDVRVLKAAEVIQKEKIAIPVLIGDKNAIENESKKNNIDISGVEVIDPLTYEKFDEYVNLLYDLRKSKGMTLDEAKKLVKDYVYFGVLMVKAKDASGLVSGAVHTTADTLRPALQIVKAKIPGQTVSSFFVMDIKGSKYKGAYIFSDCGLVQNPTSEELATICIQAADSYRHLFQKEPVCAMLSYSTYGSAKSESVLKVEEAKKMLDSKNVDFEFDGELQLDAALEPSVASLKAPECKISGRPNVLIFPNIDAGNIGYKLVERFAQARAIGPITQGLAAPINDLSRGCKTEDIVVAVAITSLQAE